MRSTPALCNIALLAGCAVGHVPGPTVSITPFGGPWTQADVDDVVAGARAWEGMGLLFAVDYDESSPLPVCPSDWAAEGLVDCRIRVGVRQVPVDELPPGAAAYTDRAAKVVTVGDRFHGRYLVHLAAHELGHIVLNTSLHLPQGIDGIMAQGTDLVEPTDADWALVCVTTGIGC